MPDFEIDNDFSEPITIAHLLTLSAGFDYRFMGLETLEVLGYLVEVYVKRLS